MKDAARLLEMSHSSREDGLLRMTNELQLLLSQAFERGRATGWNEVEELRAMVEGS